MSNIKKKNYNKIKENEITIEGFNKVFSKLK